MVEGAERPRQVSAHVFDPEHAAAVMRSRMQQGDDRSVEMMEEMAGSNENGRDNAKMLSKLEEDVSTNTISDNVVTHGEMLELAQAEPDRPATRPS